MVGVDLEVVDQDGVDLVLDVAQDGRRDGSGRGEVEAEAARGVLGAGLGRALAERVAEAPVDQVGRGVAARDRAAALDVDLGQRLLAHAQLAVADLAAVHHQARERGLDVHDVDLRAARADDALVGELAAALGVERGAVEDDLDRGARARRLDRGPVDEHADDVRLGGGVVVAEEVDLARPVEHLAEDRDVGVAGLLRRRVGLGAVALLVHQAAEAVLVDLEALLGRHLERQVDRKAVGVVELERLVAREGRDALALGLLHGRVEDRGAGAQGAEEGELLGVDHRVDVGGVGPEVGILVAHRLDGGGGQLVHVALLARAEEAQVADRAAQHAAQHVAPALVGGQHAVAHQHDAGAQVVGDDPQRDVGAVVPAVAGLGELGRPVEDLVGGVDLVDVVDTLQDRRHALEAHAGVDALGGQLARDVEVDLAAHRAELELHEDVVPDLQVAVLVGYRAAFPAVLGAAVVVDLGAGAARARHAHVPVVVGEPAALDALDRNADLVVPDVVGLVVVVVDGDPEALLGEPEAALGLGPGEELPRVRKGLLLEVVAEGEVAEHLEEAGVPRGLADLVDVEGAHDLLGAGRAGVGRLLLAEEVGLEGHHARVDQQQRRILGDKAGRGDDGVSALLEEAQEAAGDLCRLHLSGRPLRRGGFL